MKVYFLRRLLLVPVTLFGITLLVFMLMRAAPGGPVQRDLQEMMGAAASEQGGSSGMRESEGNAITPEALFEIEEKYQRDKGVWRSYVEWLGVVPRDVVRAAKSFESGEDWVTITMPRVNIDVDLIKEGSGIRIELPSETVTRKTKKEKEKIVDDEALSEEEKQALLKDLGEKKDLLLQEAKDDDGIIKDRIREYEWKARLISVEELKQRWEKNFRGKSAAHKVRIPDSEATGKASPEKSVVLRSWSREEGDEVEKGDVLATIEVGAVSSELKAAVDGVMGRILVKEGEEVAEGKVVAEIDVLQERAVLYRAQRDGLLQGSLGDSERYGDPVISMVRKRMPISLFYGVISMILIYGICIPLGIVKAIKHRTWLDNVSSIAVFSGYAIPGYVLGSFLLVFLGARLDLFPLSGFVSENFSELPLGAKIFDLFHHAVMPLSCYLVGSFAFMTFMMKNNLMDNLAADYVRTATAKGVPYGSAVFRHAFRNSIIPIATTVGQNITLLVGGSFLIEKIFDIDGFGLLQFNAILDKDEPVVLGVLTISATLMLLGNVISDLCVAFVDPRIRFR